MCKKFLMLQYNSTRCTPIPKHRDRFKEEIGVEHLDGLCESIDTMAKHGYFCTGTVFGHLMFYKNVEAVELGTTETEDFDESNCDKYMNWFLMDENGTLCSQIIDKSETPGYMVFKTLDTDETFEKKVKDIYEMLTPF